MLDLQQISRSKCQRDITSTWPQCSVLRHAAGAERCDSFCVCVGTPGFDKDRASNSVYCKENRWFPLHPFLSQDIQKASNEGAQNRNHRSGSTAPAQVDGRHKPSRRHRSSPSRGPPLANPREGDPRWRRSERQEEAFPQNLQQQHGRKRPIPRHAGQPQSGSQLDSARHSPRFVLLWADEKVMGLCMTYQRRDS